MEAVAEQLLPGELFRNQKAFMTEKPFTGRQIDGRTNQQKCRYHILMQEDGWKLSRNNYYQEGWLATANARGVVGVTYTTSFRYINNIVKFFCCIYNSLFPQVLFLCSSVPLFLFSYFSFYLLHLQLFYGQFDLFDIFLRITISRNWRKKLIWSSRRNKHLIHFRG